MEQAGFKFTVPAEIVSAMEHFQDSFNTATTGINIQWEKKLRRKSVTTELIGLMVSRLGKQDTVLDAQTHELSILVSRLRNQDALVAAQRRELHELQKKVGKMTKVFSSLDMENYLRNQHFMKHRETVNQLTSPPEKSLPEDTSVLS